MKAQPQPIASRMYFWLSRAPYTTGAVSPAADATSTKRAWKGRPDGGSFACGCAVWLAMPWATTRSAVSDAADVSDTCMNVRRVTLIDLSRSACIDTAPVPAASLAREARRDV